MPTSTGKRQRDIDPLDRSSDVVEARVEVELEPGEIECDDVTTTTTAAKTATTTTSTSSAMDTTTTTSTTSGQDRAFANSSEALRHLVSR